MMLYEKEKINRHLYLSSEISREELAPIIQAIELINQEDDNADDEVTAQVQNLVSQGIIDIESMQYPYREPIILEINSEGGEISAGFQLLTAIENSETPIIGYVTGWCMSMAIPVLLACDYRLASEYSSFMIHDISSGTIGKYTEMKHYLENGMVLSRDNYIKSVVKYSKLTRDELLEIMDRSHDYNFAPEKAIELGIVDSIDAFTDVEEMSKKIYQREESEDEEEVVSVEKPRKDKKTQIIELLSEIVDND